MFIAFDASSCTFFILFVSLILLLLLSLIVLMLIDVGTLEVYIATNDIAQVIIGFEKAGFWFDVVRSVFLHRIISTPEQKYPKISEGW